MATVLYVILFLCIFILTALGVVWLSSRKKDKPEVKEERVLDIKEPVYSFVECLKSNPKRFVLDTTKNFEGRRGSPRFEYELIDTGTGKIFKTCVVVYSYTYKSFGFTNYPQYLSQDEIRFIYNELSQVYEARRKRLQEINQIRAKRKADKEREQVMKDYCGDNKNVQTK